MKHWRMAVAFVVGISSIGFAGDVNLPHHTLIAVGVMIGAICWAQEDGERK